MTDDEIRWTARADQDFNARMAKRASVGVSRMSSLKDVGNTAAFRERLDKLKALTTSDSTADRCEGCGGSGWCQLTRENGYSVALACLCVDGQKKPATIRTIKDIATSEELQALFPHGVPSATIGFAAVLQAAGVGRVEARYTFASYEMVATTKVQKRALAVARLWIEAAPDKRSDLVLFGTHGTGKTGLAAAIAHALAERRERLRFVDLDELLKLLRSTFTPRERSWTESGGGDAGTERDIIEQLVDVSTLFIDEVTGTRLSDYAGDQMRAIVTARQKAERATVLTLNVDGRLENDSGKLETALSQMLGGALYDRLMDRGQFLAMFGNSLRGR